MSATKGKSRQQLKIDIEQTMTKVDELRAAFNKRWEELKDAPPNAKEKVERAMRAELEKLKRHRKTLQSWLETPDLATMSTRLRNYISGIEADMQRYYIHEREAKTKQFSNAALSGEDERVGPRASMRAWLDLCMTEISNRLDSLNEQLDEIQSSLGGRKSGRGARVNMLSSQIDLLTQHRDALDEVIQAFSEQYVQHTDIEALLKNELEEVLACCKEEREVMYGAVIYEDIITQINTYREYGPEEPPPEVLPDRVDIDVPLTPASKDGFSSREERLEELPASAPSPAPASPAILDTIGVSVPQSAPIITPTVTSKTVNNSTPDAGTAALRPPLPGTEPIRVPLVPKKLVPEYAISTLYVPTLPYSTICLYTVDLPPSLSICSTTPNHKDVTPDLEVFVPGQSHFTSTSSSPEKQAKELALAARAVGEQGLMSKRFSTARGKPTSYFKHRLVPKLASESQLTRLKMAQNTIAGSRRVAPVEDDTSDTQESGSNTSILMDAALETPDKHNHSSLLPDFYDVRRHGPGFAVLPDWHDRIEAEWFKCQSDSTLLWLVKNRQDRFRDFAASALKARNYKFEN